MTLTEKILDIMKGNASGKKTVFAPYENKVKQGKTLDFLLSKGMALVKRVPFYSVTRPNCKYTQTQKDIGNGFKEIIVEIETPIGMLRQVSKANDTTSYIYEHFIKSEDDFDAYRFMINDAIVSANESAVKEALSAEEYYFTRGGLPYEPFQQIIAQDAGTENFCYLWMDYPEELTEIAKCIENFNRKTFPIAAKSALPMFNYGGNVVPSIIGKNMFKNVYVPQYNEAADVLHSTNKLIGCHFDADNTLILGDIANSKLDYIEAYDTSCSPPLAEAIQQAPNKVFWLNFPSAAHLSSNEVIYDTTINLLKDGAKAKGLILGVTEDVPEDCWERSFTVIQRAIDDFYG